MIASLKVNISDAFITSFYLGLLSLPLLLIIRSTVLKATTLKVELAKVSSLLNQRYSASLSLERVWNSMLKGPGGCGGVKWMRVCTLVCMSDPRWYLFLHKNIPAFIFVKDMTLLGSLTFLLLRFKYKQVFLYSRRDNRAGTVTKGTLSEFAVREPTGMRRTMGIGREVPSEGQPSSA